MNAVVQREAMPMNTTSVTQITPMQLLQVAMDKGADLDKLQQLMDLHERWESNQAKKLYNEAFSAFKSESVEIIKNKTVTDGPLKGKSYAELFSVVNAITPALSKHGLSASWSITKDEPDWIQVTCILKHVGGYSESVSMGGKPDTGGAKNSIQSRASTVTYLERYTLKAITGLSEQNDDDDGRGTEREEPHARQQPSAQQQMPAKPLYSDGAFQANLPSWRELVKSGKKTPAAIIATISTKAELTVDQKQAINDLNKQEQA